MPIWQFLHCPLPQIQRFPLWSIYITLNNFFVCGPKFTVLFSSNVGGVVVDKLLFRFSICEHVPDIFAIKVESCQKSQKFWTIFLPSQIFGGGPSKNYTHFINPALRHVDWKSFVGTGDTPSSPEVIEDNTLNFRPNFKFSRLKFFCGTPVPLAGVH